MSAPVEFLAGMLFWAVVCLVATFVFAVAVAGLMELYSERLADVPDGGELFEEEAPEARGG